MVHHSLVRQSGEGRAFWLLDSLYVVKAACKETAGAMTVMEVTMPAGAGPPPHIHEGTESVYVLEGNLRYFIGDDTFEGGPGTFFHIPKGIRERYDPLDTARVLITYTPGGIDEFFAEVGEPAQAHELPPPTGRPPDFERLQTVGARYGIQMEPMPTR
jgi:quercetin dioxygenase-like cupin family protein